MLRWRLAFLCLSLLFCFAMILRLSNFSNPLRPCLFECGRPTVNKHARSQEITSAIASVSDLSKSSSTQTNYCSGENHERLRLAKQLSSGACDVTMGKWVYDAYYPLYKPASCPYVHERFDCHRNGRGDTGYLKWRWKPHGCRVPRFDAGILLEALRKKRLVFIGDSLSRNQAESFLCMLREGRRNRSELREVYIERDDFAFRFLVGKKTIVGSCYHRLCRSRFNLCFGMTQEYDCVVEFHRSNFLVDVVDVGRSIRSLQLDALDRTAVARNWRDADVLIFTTGHWWNDGKTRRGKIKYFQDADKLYQDMDLMLAFRKALMTWGAWVDKYVDQAATRVFFAGFSPIHFRGGTWDRGGGCRNESQPAVSERALSKYPSRMVIIEDVIRSMKTPVRILNITRLSDFRQDAHPSVYGHRPEQKWAEDCSHWCLPGVPDLWNELLFVYLVAEAPHWSSC